MDDRESLPFLLHGDPKKRHIFLQFSRCANTRIKLVGPSLAGMRIALAP